MTRVEDCISEMLPDRSRIWAKLDDNKNIVIEVIRWDRDDQTDQLREYFVSYYLPLLEAPHWFLTQIIQNDVVVIRMDDNRAREILGIALVCMETEISLLDTYLGELNES